MKGIRRLLRAARWGALVALAAAGLAGSARGALIVGVNDEAPLDPTQIGWFYPTLGAEGLQLNTLTLRWDDGAPTTIPSQQAIATAIAAAAANGVGVELDLYPLHSQIFTGAAACTPSADPQACGNSAEIEAFDAWTALVARAFPSVHQFVVMNECNQPLFVNPQWNSSGANQSAEICGRALAGAYDALKAVSSQNFVWGVGLSPRGNDNPNAASDSSTSPVAFLQDLGAWFKSFVTATGRTTPLMDGLDFHPYPIPQSQPFSQGYQSVNDASVSNLPRIYQAFYNGFNGTPQPTIGQQAGGGLPVSLNEVGIQTTVDGHSGYAGIEVSANANGGVLGVTATESYQSSWYTQMLALVACDPNVRLVNIYHLLDEADLAGWQSGLYYLDHTPKQSAAAVHDWIAASGGECQGAEHPWTPTGVAAAASPPPAPFSTNGPRILVAAGGRIRIFDALTHRLRRVLAPFGAAYSGPLSVALGERAGASVIAVGEGAGGSPQVALLDGKTGRRTALLTPFPGSFRGGVSVALGDLAGSGRDDLIVATGAGTVAQVVVYGPSGGVPLERLEPFGPSFRGGLSVAAGNLTGGTSEQLVVGSGPGMAPAVRVYQGESGTLLESLRPFAASFSGGVSVAAADLDGDGKADLIVGTGPGRVAVVKAYRDATSRRLWSVDAFAPLFNGGVSLAAFTPAGTASAEVVVAPGSGAGSQLKVLAGANGALASTFLGASGSAASSVAAG